MRTIINWTIGSVVAIAIVYGFLILATDAFAAEESELGGCVVTFEDSDQSLMFKSDPTYNVVRDRWEIKDETGTTWVFNPSKVHVWGPDGEYRIAKGQVSVEKRIAYLVLDRRTGEIVDEVETAMLKSRSDGETEWVVTFHNLSGVELTSTYSNKLFDCVLN